MFYNKSLFNLHLPRDQEVWTCDSVTTVCLEIVTARPVTLPVQLCHFSEPAVASLYLVNANGNNICWHTLDRRRGGWTVVADVGGRVP